MASQTVCGCSNLVPPQHHPARRTCRRASITGWAAAGRACPLPAAGGRSWVREPGRVGEMRCRCAVGTLGNQGRMAAEQLRVVGSLQASQKCRSGECKEWGV